MKPKKFSFKETILVDLGSKKIHRYPFETKTMSVAKMFLNGRFPQDKKIFFIEHKCSFIIIVTKGNGSVILDKEVVNVKEGDALLVPSGNKYALDGNLEYTTVVSPAYYPEQAEEVKE